MDNWDSRHGISISQCVKCRHWQRNGTCKAFPKGVPIAILANEHDHSKPYEGDGGLLFSPAS